jgi:hypothetical protein
VTGGGDWRTLELTAKSVALTESLARFSVGVGGAPSDFVIDGVRRCLWMYEAERGGAGRPLAFGPSSLYEDERLMAGLWVLEDAGDCCEGGVYGISPTQV